MIKAVIFDMYETLITLYTSTPYFGWHMARDAGIPEDEFRKLWDSSEEDRCVGNVTLEEVLEQILKDKQCISKEIHEQIVARRIAFKEECFKHLHKQVIPMLSSLKERGVVSKRTKTISIHKERRFCSIGRTDGGTSLYFIGNCTTKFHLK